MKSQEEVMQLTSRQRTLIMVPLLLGGFIAILNETILNVAFASLTDSLHVSTATVQWLTTSYMLTIGILVPVTAFLMETYTTKTLYLLAMGLFFVGALFCGVSQSFAMLLAFRILQGAGTGMLLPIMLNTILAIYPPAQRGSATGKCLIAIIVAPALGPTLSGLVLQVAGWRWLFFGMLPFAIFAIVLGSFTLRNVSALSKPRIDIPSVLLSTIGFGGFIFGVSSCVSRGFRDPVVLTALVCGVAGLLLFGYRQLHLDQPMLELRTFQFPLFRLGILILAIAFMVPFALNIILPTYLQEARGITPFHTGLLMLPAGIISAIFTPISGTLYDKLGARRLVVGGFLLTVIALLFLARLSPTVSLPQIIVLHSMVFAGTGLIVTPCQTSMLNLLPKAYHSHGVAIVNTMQQIAAALGSALFIGMMAAGQARFMAEVPGRSVAQRQLATVFGMHEAFTVALILVALALVLSLFFKHDEEASDAIAA